MAKHTAKKNKKGKSLQAVSKKLRTSGVAPLKDLTAAQKRAPGKRSSAKRAQNQK